MNKLENVDVLDALEQVMRQDTAFYQSDFQIDNEIVQQAASDWAGDRALWYDIVFPCSFDLVSQKMELYLQPFQSLQFQMAYKSLEYIYRDKI